MCRSSPASGGIIGLCTFQNDEGHKSPGTSASCSVNRPGLFHCSLSAKNGLVFVELGRIVPVYCHSETVVCHGDKWEMIERKTNYRIKFLGLWKGEQCL